VGLHSGIDTVAFVSGGAYSETYGASAIANLTNLFCSYGLFEDAPDVAPAPVAGVAKVLLGLHDGKLYLRIGRAVTEL